MKELLERLSEPLLRIYSDMQADLLVAIIKRLAADKTLLEDGAFMEWHFRKLNQLNGLTRESIAIISRSTGIAEKELIEAIRKAGFASFKNPSLSLMDSNPALRMASINSFSAIPVLREIIAMLSRVKPFNWFNLRKCHSMKAPSSRRVLSAANRLMMATNKSACMSE